MPEYLAPGVYVEETSFRAKSIEGVSTSTTGFVGPALKGPVGGLLDGQGRPTGPGGGLPELLTSFGDFQRIYGGLDDLSYGTNYLAHAVRAYFNEGGSRLYVSRAYRKGADDGTAASPPLGGNDDAHLVRFVARVPGLIGNGTLRLQEASTPATRRSLEQAPLGSLARVGGANPESPARLLGAAPPFNVPPDGVLKLTVTVDGNATPVQVQFRGKPAEAFGTDALPDPVSVADADKIVTLTIDGVSQKVTLPGGNIARDDLIFLLNRSIRGGYVRLSTAADQGAAGRLVVGSDRRGTLSTVVIAANPSLKVASAQSTTSPAAADNNVGSIDRVTADEINTLLTAATQNVADAQLRAVTGPDGRLAITTVKTGAGVTLAVEDAGDGSAHTALGLTVGPAVKGAAGTTVSYYVKSGDGWADASKKALDLSNLKPSEAPAGGAEILTLTVIATDATGDSVTFDGLGFDRRSSRWVGTVLSDHPARRVDDLENLYALEVGPQIDGFSLYNALLPSGGARSVTMGGGNDGVEPIESDYEAALAELESIEDIAIVGAPGHGARTDHEGIIGAMIAHAERPRAYRIAVLETPPHMTPTEARLERGKIDSTRAALYYPWVVVSDPLARPSDGTAASELVLPPTGYICGIYARNDVEHGVAKAPANEVVYSALRFETDVKFAEQETLNPIGVNCLRFLTGRGYRVWGARTATSDPEWKYVNVRRYFNYLERSIDVGTQWVVFENNGERLWANVTETITSFLYSEWQGGSLLGATPAEAYFVKCDRSTMTQNDLDNGRLVCLIGVAALKPAEFVIFRIGQKTAD